MSTPVMILGESGTGKSHSMHRLDPTKTLLIQSVKKPLSFKAEGWARWDSEKKFGNIFVSDVATDVIALMKGTKKKIIVVDDFQYILANELMRRYRETGYGKFSETGYNGWNIFGVASSLPDDVHVYIMGHTMIGDDGITKIKTPGKLLETYTMEGLCSMVLRTHVDAGVYSFSTKNSGSDTVKSPPGMFVDEGGVDLELIPNDLKYVDECVTKFGW